MRGRAVRGQRPASIVLLGAWREQGSRTTPDLGPFLKSRQGQSRVELTASGCLPAPLPQILHKPFPADLQSHASETLFLPGELFGVTWSPNSSPRVYSLLSKTHCTTHQHAAATCMFNLGFIFMVNDSQELSVIFVPLVLPEETPMSEEACTELRPRLCVIQRGSNGYGFNLHSERARPGQYIRAVDEDSPAERAGLQPKDRIVQVNGVPVEGKTHSEVVAAIKVGGNVVHLLVVDPDTDTFFKRCRVAPTTDHINGPLPEPVINGGMEEKVNGRAAKEEQRDSKLSVSPSPSNASSNTSLTTPPTNTPPESLNMDTIPALNLSLQQVKELAHQKRSNKRAPPMDWTKKNELFSNL
ncbi:Na(+)/H(+) exchange regulatory cofactor NHE-RF1 [Nibea albiflora]|uniref:Na(+)/H(+) exchange regulatory cofactor NHE-RF1 n=1 Tax=Nibea albiflora TaxID=240163 RepID=A0ACB7EY27_NIBAL|nr:Na(+)/H(+) exchange regulatory cofactor NHE-RF1 [Nibea albiflora]